MTIPEIEKESTNTCAGCGEILLPHAVVCNSCNTVIKTHKRGTWSDYNTIENAEDIVIQDITNNRKELDIVEEPNHISVKHSSSDLLPERKQYNFSFLRRCGALIFLLVVFVSLLIVSLNLLK